MFYKQLSPNHRLCPHCQCDSDNLSCSAIRVCSCFLALRAFWVVGALQHCTALSTKPVESIGATASCHVVLWSGLCLWIFYFRSKWLNVHTCWNTGKKLSITLYPPPTVWCTATDTQTIPLFSLNRKTSHLIENLSLKRLLKPSLSDTCWFLFTLCKTSLCVCTQSHTKSVDQSSGS